MFLGRQTCRCIFISTDEIQYFTMAPETNATEIQSSRQRGTTPSPPVRDPHRDESSVQREELRWPRSGATVPACPILVISTRVTHQPLTQEEQPASFDTSLPAELLQLLNLPVVPQLGGEGASLGPTRQPCARTWELYLCSYYIISVSLSLSA